MQIFFKFRCTLKHKLYFESYDINLQTILRWNRPVQLTIKEKKAKQDDVQGIQLSTLLFIVVTTVTPYQTLALLFPVGEFDYALCSTWPSVEWKLRGQRTGPSLLNFTI